MHSQDILPLLELQQIGYEKSLKNPMSRLLVLFTFLLFRMRERQTATEKEFGIVLQMTLGYILTRRRIHVK